MDNRKKREKKQSSDFHFPDITAMAMTNEMTGAVPAIVPDDAQMENYRELAGLEDKK